MLSHGRGRWFNPSRAHQVFREFSKEKTALGCSVGHDGPDNGAGQRPALRRNIADAMLAVAIAAGCIAGLAMWGHKPPTCGISASEAMPWVLEQRAGCPEARP